MADEIAIKVDHVSKIFKLPHEKQSSIKSSLISLIRGGAGGYEEQKALDDISFEVKKGEFFGIVGRNGSGKSTMLKLLAGIYTPTKGTVQVNGKLTPFIELGVGFNPELTGRENVFLNGALLGFNRTEMLEMYDDIVEFAEIERFMDQKLKNYSSGMQVRLAFSIATRAKSDILLVDEVLAVGDAAFQAKCFDYFLKLKQAKQTIVFVTHDMNAVKRFCDRALMIKNGELLFIDKPARVAMEYAIANSPDTADASENETHEDKDITIDKINVTGGTGGKKNHFLAKDTVNFSISYTVKTPRDISIGMCLRRPDTTYLVGASSKINLGKLEATPGKHELQASMPAGQFTEGVYYLNIAMVDYDTGTLIDYIDTTAGQVAPKLYILEKDEQRDGELNLDIHWNQAT